MDALKGIGLLMMVSNGVSSGQGVTTSPEPVGGAPGVSQAVPESRDDDDQI